MEKLFPEIASLDDVMRLVRGGVIAGSVFAALILLDSLLTTFWIWPAGWQGTHTPVVELAGGAAEIALVLFLSWRVSTGHGFVSAILLLALFVMATIAGVRDGLFGLAWMAAYFGLGLMLLNAVRASLRHDALSHGQAPSGKS